MTAVLEAPVAALLPSGVEPTGVCQVCDLRLLVRDLASGECAPCTWDDERMWKARNP